MKKLSLNQTEILLMVYRRTLEVEEFGVRLPHDWVGHSGRMTSVAWRPKPENRSESASFSRSLKRLVQRGLLERHNTVSGEGRTTGVELTEFGRDLARRLAESDWGTDWWEKHKTETVNKKRIRNC